MNEESKSIFYFCSFQEGTNLPQSVKDGCAGVSTNIQPYIVCVKGQNNHNSFFIQGDGWFVKPHNCNPVTAFDLLFKAYFVLNLCYPRELNNFYNFIEAYVYDLGKKSRGVVASLHINLSNLKLDKSCNASALADDNYVHLLSSSF